jgi:hypothetical protein
LRRAFVLALASYILLRPAFGAAHELSVAGVATLLGLVVSTDWWQPVILLLRLDPVYAGAAVRAVGGLQVAGISIAGPVGAWLHAVVPRLVLEPLLAAPGAAISVVAAPGAPALGRVATPFIADVLWLCLGVWLSRSRKRFGPAVALLGLFIQAQIVVNHLLDAQVTLPDLNASGIPFALAVAMPGKGWFTSGLDGVGEPARSLLMGGMLVVIGYACAAVVLTVLVGGDKLIRHVSRAAERPVGSGVPVPRWFVLAGAAVGVAAAVSPVGSFVVGKPSWQATPRAASMDAVPGAAGRLRDLLSSTARTGPTHVEIVREANGSWTYEVDGQPRVIRGVGYNPQYAGLPVGQRAQLYRRDFTAMHQLGINTIEGWFEQQFDQVTLDNAAQSGIGVLMPFELNQDWNYADPNVQAGILARVSAYVEQYKDHPAVRMWAPGNEDLHRILYPHWVSQENDPAVKSRADAFAAFLPLLVDRIHALDPDHPVIYRDAEDVYLPRLKAAFEATGVNRPWLVYGANVYSEARLKQIVDAWPNQWMNSPLVLSEFAPGGAGPADRPVGFEQDWAVIRSRPGIVLGGLAYTWATNGPEDLDRVFGFVDAAGVPSDGALAALSASYLADLQQTAAGSPPT